MQRERLTKIYCLWSTRSPFTIRYIGKTVSTLAKRLQGHKDSAKRNNYKAANWIKKEYKDGFAVKISLLEECYNWDKREKYWIKYYKNCGNNLCNIQEGGVDKKHMKRVKKFYIENRPKIYCMDENNNIVTIFENSRKCADMLNVPIVELLKCCKRRESGYDAICHGYRFTRDPDVEITKKFNYWQSKRTPNILQVDITTNEIIKEFNTYIQIYKELGHHVKTIKKYINSGKFLDGTMYFFKHKEV